MKYPALAFTPTNNLPPISLGFFILLGHIKRPVISLKEPKKIRIFAPDFPLPIQSGADHVVANQWLGLLELGHEVELICWRENPTSIAKKIKTLEQQARLYFPILQEKLTLLKFQVLDTLPHEQESLLQKFRRVILSLLTDRASPEQVYYPLSTSHFSAWIRLRKNTPVDYEIYCYSFAYSWLNHTKKSDWEAPQTKAIVHFHNLESELFRERTTQAKNLISRWILRRNTQLLEKHEKALSSRALTDELWFLSREDLNQYHQLTGPCNSHRLMPPLISKSLQPVLKQERQRNDEVITLGIIGNFYFGPNADSLEWLLNELMPTLRKLNGGRKIRVLVAGKGVSDFTLKKASALETETLSITFLGFVEDLESHFWSQIDLNLTPNVSGSGVRIKLLDAIQRRIPVITHTRTLKTLPIEAESSIVAKDQPEEWVAEIFNLLLNRAESPQTRNPPPCFDPKNILG